LVVARALGDTVNDRVLDQRLKDQTRYGAIQSLGIDHRAHRQPVFKPDSLNAQVEIDKVQFFIYVVSTDRSTGKWASISIAYVHVNGKADTSGASSPQSSYSNIGENSRDNWVGDNATYANGTVHLPRKVELSSIFDVRNGTPYNITTGTDANGDGDFNDRPSYASAPGEGVYSTPFGLLTTNTVNGNVPRNLGTMPTVMHLDANLSRAFTLNPRDKDRARTLTFNARSANLLNHTNVTAVNTVLSSSAIGQPLAAETARRVELGVRFAF
jgi:hypothetical protein